MKLFLKQLSMLNKLKKTMGFFKEIISDENTINEKSLVGFLSFVVMVLFAVTDLVTGYFGKDLVINETVYNSFVIITLGAFGIAEAGKMFGGKKEEK